MKEKYIRETWYAVGKFVYLDAKDEVCQDCGNSCRGRKIQIAEVKTESEDVPLIAEMIAQAPHMRRLIEESDNLGCGMEALIRLKRIQTETRMIALKFTEAKQ